MGDSDLLGRLLATFQLEGVERLESMSRALLALEGQPEAARRHTVESIFRDAHSLKGAARAVNLAGVESVCQALEEILSDLKGGRMEQSHELIELLHTTVDTLGRMLSPSPENEAVADELVSALERVNQHVSDSEARDRYFPEVPAKEPMPAAIPSPRVAQARQFDAESSTATTSTEPVARRSTGTVRIAVDKLEVLTRQVEGLVSQRLAAGQLARDLRSTAELAQRWQKRWRTLQPILRLIERKGEKSQLKKAELRPLLEYLEAQSLELNQLEGGLAHLTRNAEREHRQISSVIAGIQSDVKELHMMPASSLLEMFPRLVRDLGKELGKDVRLVMTGEEIAVDRRLLEELKDPLIHLLRNSIDHGIEAPEERQRRQKPSPGTVTVAIEQRHSNKLEVRVTDDGAGVDLELLRRTVVRQGLVNESELGELDDRSLLQLAFHSGISTSRLITDLSGRGLGLTIVREKIENLGGLVEITSTPAEGTSFRLDLPLSVATFHALLIRMASRLFALPATSVDRVVRFRRSDVRTVESRETIVVNNETLALVELSTVLGLPSTPAPEEGPGDPWQQAVLLANSSRLALVIQELVGEQEILVKPLGPQLARVNNIAGATVLGDGRVVPVLNVADLVQSAVQTSPPAPVGMSEAKDEATSQSRILVVEDSVTSRSLLKGILESAGYRVSTATDGLAGFTALKTESFDLVISDVDMPRMNGLDLTAKIRAENDLAEIPVILVTSLSSAEDRERGVEVGANAYIVKSGFDQGNLLGAVQRLVG